MVPFSSLKREGLYSKAFMNYNHLGSDLCLKKGRWQLKGYGQADLIQRQPLPKHTQTDLMTTQCVINLYCANVRDWVCYVHLWHQMRALLFEVLAVSAWSPSHGISPPSLIGVYVWCVYEPETAGFDFGRSHPVSTIDNQLCNTLLAAELEHSPVTLTPLSPSDEGGGPPAYNPPPVTQSHPSLPLQWETEDRYTQKSSHISPQDKSDEEIIICLKKLKPVIRTIFFLYCNIFIIITVMQKKTHLCICFFIF